MKRTLDERDLPCASVAYPRSSPAYNVVSKTYFNWLYPTLPRGYRNLHAGHVDMGEYYMEISTPKGTSAREVRRDIAHLFGKGKFSVRRHH